MSLIEAPNVYFHKAKQEKTAMGMFYLEGRIQFMKRFRPTVRANC